MTMEAPPTAPSTARPARLQPIAPVWHTITFLAIFVALTVAGWSVQRSVPVRPISDTARVRLVPLQVQAIVFEWALVGWVWFGIRRTPVRLADVIAGRWASRRAFIVDLILGGALCALWLIVETTTTAALGPDTRVAAIPFPVGPIETGLAVIVALSAGVCEEIVFRGYFQRQFAAWSGSAAVGVILQALVFGPSHFYEGVRLTVLASGYALLFGSLALWRRTLRPGMIAHAASDLLARVLRVA